MAEFYREIARERQAHPGDDILSELTKATVDDGPLTEDEIANIASLLTSASLDTTASALSLMCLWLVAHPESRDRLAADPT